jgi:hypothetical protein
VTEDSTQLKVAKIGAAATIIAALIGLLAVFVPRIGNDDGGTSKSGGPTTIDFSELRSGVGVGVDTASVFLNTLSGPGGSTIKVSGKGFAPNEEVVIRFHATEVGSTTANAQGKFDNVAVVVPSSYSQFAPQQFNVVATGRSSLRSDEAPFTISG